MASVNDLAIDLGTSNILIYMKGKGIILREPTVVAIDRDTRDVLAFGEEARRMIGRTPGNILAIRPLREGVISDYELVSYMLKGFVLKAVGKHMFARPRAILSLPTGVNEMERRSIISTMFDAGMRRTQLLDRTIAAAIGAGLPIDEAYGTMIVDISAGVSDVAVLSLGKVVVSDCSKVGGDKLDDAIIRYLRRKHNLLIGERTAEELKINIGSAIPRSDQLYMEVTGRNLISGLPKTMRITSDDVTEAIDEPLQQLIESIHGVLEHTPAELAADIFEYGILLTGGGAELFGLCEAIADALKVPCSVAEDPQTNVVMGCGKALENLADLGKFLDDNRRRLIGR
ncbi:MAG TPA: rod shape-determining protein [Candidatus Limiplasma sp.]|jgi:rod shape-determining protein MreB|nr:rod shape-determining protein [Candidatus Limiplasma sp.]